MKVGGLLRTIDDYQGNILTLFALKLAPHVFVRPGELRFAEWSEIDFDKAVWTIPAGRMKMRKPHHVPLSRQAIALFKVLRDLFGERGGFIFPSVRSTGRPMLRIRRTLHFVALAKLGRRDSVLVLSLR